MRILAFALILFLVSPATHAGTLFEITEVVHGVYVARSLDPLGLANHSNAVFIINDEDAILIDTQFTLERTQAVLGTLRQLTEKPVGVLVNTHWHDDHTFGNQVIVDAFPKVQVIAQKQTKDDMLGIGVENRKQQVEGGPGALAYFRSCIEKKTNVAGQPMSDEEMTAYQSANAIFEEYLSDQARFRLTAPTTTFDHKLVLERGKRTIEIRHIGSAVTPGDAVVYLPAEGVLIAGDVVDNPVPFAYRSNVKGWIAALDEIKKLNPRTIVPGHGEVMRDMQGVDRLRAMLVSIRDQTNAAVANGDSLQAVQAKVKIDDMRAATVGTNKMLAFLFDDFFLKPAVASAFQEASHK